MADPGPIVLLEDLNGDGMRDVAIELGQLTHVFYGGPAIGSRLAEGRSSGVLINASLAGVALSRSWSLVSSDRSTGLELLLPRMNFADAASTRSGRIVPAGPATLSFHPDGMATSPMLDARAPGRTTLVLDSRTVFWGTGDFNGDGRADVLLGPAPDSHLPAFQIIVGPFASGAWMVPEFGAR